jgi:hypothetical protein
MSKPRIFLGSSTKQAKLLQAPTRGLEDVAEVEPWTVSFNPGCSGCAGRSFSMRVAPSSPAISSASPAYGMGKP